MIHKTLIILCLLIAFIANAKADDDFFSSYAFNRGFEAYNEDNYPEALEWLNKEVKEHPGNGYAYIYISMIRSENGEYGKALTAINQAIKLIPKKDLDFSAIAYMKRADTYLALEDTTKALNDYNTAIKFAPENKNLYDRRGQLYFEQGNYDLADTDYRKMTSLDPGAVMGYMGLGRNLKMQERYDEAIDQFNYVIKLAPDYNPGYTFRSDCYIAQKKYSEAMDDIIKALTISEDRKACYNIIPISKEALSLVKAKLQVQANKNPNEATWYYYLGQAYEINNKPNDAIYYYKQAINRNAHAVYMRNIANCYLDMGQYDSALDYINRAINMDSNDYSFIKLKGNIYNEMGRYSEAIAELDKYVTKYPDYYFGYYRRGWFKNEADDAEGAIDDYTMAIILEPSFAYAYNSRGKLYQRQGKTDLAKADFEKVIELDSIPDPGVSCAHFAFHYLGQRDKAIAFLDSLIAESDDPTGCFYDAACLYSIMDEKETALNYLTKAFERGFRRIAHTNADHDLDNIRDLPGFKALIQKYSDEMSNESEIISQNGATMTHNVEIVEIPFTKESGVTKVKCTINGLPLHFVFDTGAADVTISMVEAIFMLKNDYITPEDIIGSAHYLDANGDITEGTVINLRKVNFGGLELDNVRASVVRNQKAPLLLGQTVLGRLGKIEIDNPGMKLIITL